jgi:hypothetical protein
MLDEGDAFLIISSMRADRVGNNPAAAVSM